jgi:CelD/BcsL family acetyltransferase involved in cellulose biosynthesis
VGRVVIRAEVIRDAAELKRLRGPWEDLLARSSNDEPTMSPTWMMPWWSIFGGDGARELRALALFDRARLVGFAPLVLRPWRIAPGVTARRLELLGTGEDEKDEISSDYLGPLVERGLEAAVTDAFVDALGLVGRWDELVLSPMSGESPIGVLIGQALRERGFMVRLEVAGASFHVPLPKTWDAYLGALPASRRAMVRRSIRAFEAWAGVNAELEVVSSAAELERAKEELVRLHGARWAGAGGAFASARFRAFHDAVMPELFAKGALELAFLRAKGRAVAAIYNIVWRDKVRFYQSGRAVDVPGDVRPGIVLHARAIERAIGRGLREYDFLPSLARYKVELSLASRPVHALRAARPGAFEMARRGGRARPRAGPRPPQGLQYASAGTAMMASNSRSEMLVSIVKRLASRTSNCESGLMPDRFENASA